MRANNLRKGNVVLYRNEPYRIMDFHHVTPGKGNAVVQTKMRNLLTGNQTEARFMSTEDVDIADVYTSKATYLYQDADNFCFMDTSSYEQFSLSKDFLGDDVYYIQENMEVGVTIYNESPIGIELPTTVTLTIVETEPELRGATASNSPKPAKTDTGLQLSIPPFVKEGERIIVNTADGTYMSRAD
jgi:elongation factor P